MGASPGRPAVSLLAALALAAAGAAGAHAASPPHAVVVSLAVSTPQGWPLPASGATVLVSVRVRNAVSCTFLAQRRTFSSLYPLKTVACASGSAALAVPAITNSHFAPVRVAYGVLVRGADGGSTMRVVRVAQRGATPKEPRTGPPGEPQQSENWSGYVLSGASSFTRVSGRWTVPTLDCTATPSGGAAAWAGIGGYPSQAGAPTGALLQTGITTDCIDGVQQNRGWWEEYPSDPNRSADFADFPVSAGDLIEASVFVDTAGAWETRVDDLTTGVSGVMVTGSGWGLLTDGGDGTVRVQGDTSAVSFSGGNTAEWIVEDYDELGAPVPLAAYGSVSFTDLATSLPGWTLAAANAVEIVQNGVVRSAPSAPTASGFSVAYRG